VNEPLTPMARRAGPAGRLAAGLLLALLVLASLPAPSASAASTPSGLRSTAVTPTTMSLAWRAVAHAPKYRVQVARTSSMAGAKYYRSAGTSKRVTGLKASTTYYVKVRVISTRGANLSSYSRAVKVRTARKAVAAASASAPLRVGSYNIKCANCFSNLPNELRWAERRSAVVSAIRNENLDVIGVQEASQGWLRDAAGRPVELSQFEDLQRRLGGPYQLTNSARNNCVRSTTPTRCQYRYQGASQGTRILYNASRVEVLASGSKLLPSRGGAANSRYLAWAVLRQRSTGLRFFFANAHLEATKGAYALRKREAATAVRTIKARNTAKLPVIAVGDFNSSRFADPANAPYDAYVKAGFRDPLGGVANSTRAVRPAAARRVSTWLNSFNGFVRHAKGNRKWDNGSYIDYMLTTPMRVTEWKTVARLDSRGNFVGVIPSDHNLLRMTVYLPRR
jgi:endonuclease/exonuclease/phosphatase family metal-dependent hydrolase